MTITVEYQPCNKAPRGFMWVLMATGLGGKSIAGPRILRGGPWPQIRWQHETREEAEVDAKKLQDYLDALPKAKKTKKKSTDRSAYD